MILLIAWRNIWRSKLRSLVIICAVAFGLWGGLCSVAMMMGMMDTRAETVVKTEKSHIQIHHPHFRDAKELDLFIDNGPQITADISQRPGVKALCQRIVVQGMASSAATGTGVVLYGIDVEQEQQVTNIHEKIVDGAYFEGVSRNPVVLSQKLADKLKLKIRSKVVITLQALNGDITAGAFRVAGIFKTSSAPFDESTVFVRADDLSRILNIGDQIHEIALLLDDETQLKPIAAQLQADYPQQEVKTYLDLSPDIAYANDMMKQMSYIILAIILFALAFGIVNTMLMAVLERVHELGMLMAVGMNKRNVFIMLVLETIFLSLIGGVVGMALGAVTIRYFSTHGIDLSAVAQGMESYGLESVLYLSLDGSYYPILAAMVVVTAILAAIYPAIKALRLRPAEAIRTV